MATKGQSSSVTAEQNRIMRQAARDRKRQNVKCRPETSESKWARQMAMSESFFKGIKDEARQYFKKEIEQLNRVFAQACRKGDLETCQKVSEERKVALGYLVAIPN